MTVKKKRSGILLKKPRSITATTTVRKPSSLKPLRARQLIRRFHILLKNKSLILSKLSKSFELDLTDTNCDSLLISKNKRLKEKYNSSKEIVIAELKVNKTPSTEDFKLDGLSNAELVSKLGEIDGEIQKRGGLEAYQSASTQGQDQKRGGDSSKKLMEWLKELNIYQNRATDPKTKSELTAIEVGCLSSKNLISTSRYFKHVEKLDLNSQEPGIILQQDFMERPLPKNESEKFNLVSCSLVVNFVPKPELRGEMMKRMTEFLLEPTEDTPSLLFFVLPLPCVENSRYFDNDKLSGLMTNLGFECLKYYDSNKLAYWLYTWKGSKCVNKNFKVSKKELHKGSNRNNFCIVVK